jgi:hypothetical protein
MVQEKNSLCVALLRDVCGEIKKKCVRFPLPRNKRITAGGEEIVGWEGGKGLLALGIEVREGGRSGCQCSQVLAYLTQSMHQ